MCVWHAANESLAGWSTHQLQLNSWPLQSKTEKRLGVLPHVCQMWVGMATDVIQLSGNLVPKTGTEIGTKQKAGNYGRDYGISNTIKR